ncbi:MAG: CoA transferase [Dehalococcoidia bacterium]|nr:CoA transferase [Dehalococcoidia bacterium]
MAQVFDGITVLDFTRGMPGGVATMVMSDFGAEVIKVEAPSDDKFRRSSGSIQWNRGKKSVILDLKTQKGLEQAHELSRISDVVIESFRPGVTRRLGIDYPNLSADHPELVYASLTGFGPEGPYANYKGYDAVVAAKTGRMMMFSGQNTREGPNYVVVKGVCHSAATALIRGITTALYLREKTGLGQMVETSMLKTVTTYDHISWIHGQMIAKDPDTHPPDPRVGIGRPNPTGYLPARTKDGRWIQLGNIVERLFRSMIHSLELDFIYDDPRYKTAPFLAEEHVASLERMMLEKIQEKTLEEWMSLFAGEGSDVAAEPYMTSESALRHPQILHNGHVGTVDYSGLGEMHQLGPMVIMAETPGSPKGPAPYPGQHTDEVLASIEMGNKPATKITHNQMPETALKGITLLDLGTVINGPLGCALVAELGARVIRIEALDGDWGRQGIQGISVQRTMAGSEGICLNLKTPEGQEIMQKLAAKADMLLHSMRPGAPERTGIGYEQLTKINPDLIYLYAGGYGSTGPYSHRPSMAPIAGAVSGGGVAQMGRDSFPPQDQAMTIDEIAAVSKQLKRANDGTADHTTAMVNSVGLVLGLYARERTGKAQYVESTMIAANAYANADDFYWHKGKDARRLPDRDGYGLDALYRLYQAKGGWVFLACPFEEEWRALCKAIGRIDLLEDSRFSTRATREENDESLIEELTGVFSSREPLYWEKLLTDADVACVKAEDRGMYHFFNEDVHVRENGFLQSVEATRLGEFWRYTPVVGFSATEGKAGPAPLRGEHTRPVLRELGYTDDQIQDYKQRGIVDWEEE